MLRCILVGLVTYLERNHRAQQNDLFGRLRDKRSILPAIESYVAKLVSALVVNVVHSVRE